MFRLSTIFNSNTVSRLISIYLVLLVMSLSFSCKKEVPEPEEEVIILGTRLKSSTTYRDGELLRMTSYTYTNGLRTASTTLSYDKGILADSSRFVTIRQGNWQRTSSQRFIGTQWQDQNRVEIFALDDMSKEVKRFTLTNGEPILLSFKKFRYSGSDCIEEEHFGYQNGGQNQHYRTEVFRESPDYTYSLERYESPIDGEWYVFGADSAFYNNGLKTRTALWVATEALDDWRLRIEHLYTYAGENLVEHTRRTHYDDGTYGDVTTTYTNDIAGLVTGSSQISPATGALFTREYIYEEGDISQSNWNAGPLTSIFGS